jgi:uncharacterized membrane protein YgdD (TMEM256/DUF423 family)
VIGLTRFAIVAGAMLGGVAVAAGAFGAHGLKAALEASGQINNWETAARYAMVHALALVAVGLFAAVRPDVTGLATSAWCFLVGTLIFSGCLAVITLTDVKMLGAIVPVGGILLIAGWAWLALAAARISR